MNEPSLEKPSKSSLFSLKDVGIYSWLPWVLLHLWMSEIVLNSAGPRSGLFELMFYYVASWGLAVVYILFYIFSKNASRGTALTIVILLAGPVFTTLYEGTRNYLIVDRSRAGAEEVERLCEQYGGTKIYRKVENVRGVFQMVPIPPDEDLSQYGRRYSWHRINGDSENAEAMVSHGGHAYLFVERIAVDQDQKRPYLRTELKNSGITRGEKNRRNSRPGDPYLVYETTAVNELQSQYGWYVEDLTTKEMKKLWVAGGRVKIIELATNDVLAEQTGFYLANGKGNYPWSSNREFTRFCPREDFYMQSLIPTVLKPLPIDPLGSKLDLLTE